MWANLPKDRVNVFGLPVKAGHCEYKYYNKIALVLRERERETEREEEMKREREKIHNLMKLISPFESEHICSPFILHTSLGVNVLARGLILFPLPRQVHFLLHTYILLELHLMG